MSDVNVFSRRVATDFGTTTNYWYSHEVGINYDVTPDRIESNAAGLTALNPER